MQVARLKIELVYLGRAYKFLKEYKEEDSFPFLQDLYKAKDVDAFIEAHAEDLMSMFRIKEELPVEEDED